MKTNQRTTMKTKHFCCKQLLIFSTPPSIFCCTNNYLQQLYREVKGVLPGVPQTNFAYKTSKAKRGMVCWRKIAEGVVILLNCSKGR